jgi:anti-sigma regulatory factor (Ser/Thr protein kinase)
MEIANLPRQICVGISDTSGVGQARRRAAAMAEALGLNQVQRGNLGIVVTEAARNLVSHARAGQLLLHPFYLRGNVVLDVLALDKGPGIADLAAAMRDGHSTAGSAGQGLGAISRLASLFDVYSVPGQGTAVLARMDGPKLRQARGSGFEVGGICVPVEGESTSGDDWACCVGSKRALVTVIDGLGHGPIAAEASEQAKRIFFEHARSGNPVEILDAAHAALRSTRGAAMAVCAVDFQSRTLRFACVGNISSMLLTHETVRNMVSANGIVGSSAFRLQEYSYDWPSGALLVMHSDGLQSRWTLQPYPGLLQRHPSLIAGVLYRDLQRRRDDTCVAVARLDAPMEGRL